MVKGSLIVAILAIWATPAYPQYNLRDGELPPRGSDLTVTAGNPIYQTFKYGSAAGLKALEEMTVSTKGWGQIRIAKGTVLYLHRYGKRPKACLEMPTQTLFNNPCAIDMDGNGTFDRLAPNDVAGAKDLAAPVPYESDVEFVTPNVPDSFKKVLIYQGYAQGILRISYREFSNDMARPAFTEDFTFELNGLFPQTISIKNQRFELLKISNQGISFRRN